MKAELFLILSEMIGGIFIVIIFHEMMHWIFAKIFRRQPKIKILKFLTPTVVYDNNQNDWQNLIIASSAPFILIALGLCITIDSIFTFTIKMMCFTNFFNLLPITTDGELILLSLLNLLKKKNA